MYVAALDPDSIRVSTVWIDDAWWYANKPNAAARMQARSPGFTPFEMADCDTDPIERKITCWPEFDDWITTLFPA